MMMVMVMVMMIKQRVDERLACIITVLLLVIDDVWRMDCYKQLLCQ